MFQKVCDIFEVFSVEIINIISIFEIFWYWTECIEVIILVSQLYKGILALSFGEDKNLLYFIWVWKAKHLFK